MPGPLLDWSDPAEFAVTAGQAALARAASIISAHTAGQIISIIGIHAADLWGSEIRFGP